MAFEQQDHLSTLFDITDRATAPLMSLGKGFEGAQVAISKTTSLLSPLNLALGAIGGGLSLKAVEDIGSAFENNRIQMAQTMKSMGQGGANFQDALANADRSIERVNAAAAALPGEAEDYQKALQLAGVQVQNALGDYDKTFDLIKDMTAIGVSMGENSSYTAIQLNRMLAPQKGMLETASEYTQKILTAMHALPGQANLTAMGFNNMRLEDRVKLVEQMRGQFTDMIEASSGTLDAIKGASQTIFKIFTQKATAPLFDGMKEGLKYINDQLMDAEGHATALGQTFIDMGNTLSGKIVDGIKALTTANWRQSLLESDDQMTAPVAAGAAAGGLASLGGAATGLAPLVLLGGVLGELSTRTEFLGEMFEAVGSLIGRFEPLLNTGAEVFQVLTLILADAVEGVLPGLIDALSRISAPLVWFATEVGGLVVMLGQQLRPVFENLWKSLDVFFTGVADFVIPILKFLGMALLGLWSLVSQYIVPVFSALLDGLSQLIKWIGQALSWLGQKLEGQLASMGAAPGKDPVTNALEGFMEMFKGFGKRADAESGKMGAPAAPGQRGAGGRVSQDFRFSRFEISQKFEEGFDPDRVAVAFASDLGKLGEQRSQSGFAPLFSVGV